MYKQITLRLPQEVYEALKGISVELGLSVTTVLTISILNSVLKSKLLKL